MLSAENLENVYYQISRRIFYPNSTEICIYLFVVVYAMFYSVLINNLRGLRADYISCSIPSCLYSIPFSCYDMI
jgi:hypothetical protein